MVGFVPSFNSVGEAGLPIRQAGFPIVGDAELTSHGALFLADVSREGWRACQPGVEPGFADHGDRCLAGGDNRLDRSALADLSGSESVRMN
jgi:hypothetical protein